MLNALTSSKEDLAPEPAAQALSYILMSHDPAVMDQLERNGTLDAMTKLCGDNDRAVGLFGMRMYAIVEYLE